MYKSMKPHPGRDPDPPNTQHEVVRTLANRLRKPQQHGNFSQTREHAHSL